MYSAAGFSDQKPVEFKFCGYPLIVPSKHFLMGFFSPNSPAHQPYRETGLVKIVQALERQKRSGTAIDIGGNVGDTCAIIHRHSSKLEIVSIEASDFFFPYLTKNIRRLFDKRAVAKQAFVVATLSESPKGLYHWGAPRRRSTHRSPRTAKS